MGFNHALLPPYRGALFGYLHKILLDLHPDCVFKIKKWLSRKLDTVGEPSNGLI